MAISLKTAGSWVENTSATPTVTLTGSPAAGDRYYIWAAWKTFSITASMTGWTEVTEFTDGAVATGVSVGSMKVACWYKDWVSGDTNPTLTFSTATNLLSQYVCHLWQKGATESWGTPTFVTAAWPSQSTGTVSASSPATTTDGAVVMALVGIRNDTVLFTRTTSSISDGATTWNGNYVESPATHQSTATGNDMACDLGHRFVTTGARAVTLTTGATLSAAETGAILWVVQPLAGPLASSVTDPFDTTDTGKWDWFFGVNSAISGRANVVCDSNFGLIRSLTADGRFFNLTGCSVVVELPQAANGGAGVPVTQLAVRYPGIDAYSYALQISGGFVRLIELINDVESTTGPNAYDATAHRWLRIREAGGTLFWDTSPDGKVWTNQRNKAVGMALTNLELVMMSGTGTGGPFTALFDNFNLAPPPLVVKKPLTCAVRRAGIY